MMNRTQIFRDPVFRSLASLASEFDRACAAPARPVRVAAPAMNILATEDALTIEADVPGMALDDIEIILNGDELTIRGSRPHVEQEGVSVLRRERPAGAFERTFTLPTDIDSEHANASIDRGVLTITLPKSQAARPRRLTITPAHAPEQDNTSTPPSEN